MPQPVRQTDTDHAKVLSRAVAETARRLGLGSTQLKGIIGISQPTASRLLNGRYTLAPGSKSWELSAQLVRLYRSLASLVGGEDELARAWLDSPNAAFDDRAPLAVIATVEGLIHACDYLDAHRARV